MNSSKNHVENLAVLSIVIAGGLLILFWTFDVCRSSNIMSSITANAETPKDELEMILDGASMEENRTLIIAMVNKAYVEGDGKTMLDLFLESFWLGGENTRPLLDHLLLVTVDQTSYDRCIFFRLHCYRLVTEGVDFGGEKLYMSNEFIKMMWRRTLFLTDVLKRGYNFIFTDTDIMWLNNPFQRLSQDVNEDMQVSCDGFNGDPWSEANPMNTGFYFVRSNNKTITLFDTWYMMKDNSKYKSKKEQDVLKSLMKKGLFRELGLKVRFLDTLYFSGFCKDSKDFKVVVTVHANCCRSISAKITDLTALLGDWKRFKAATNETLPTLRWSRHLACGNSWRNQSLNHPYTAITRDELEIALDGASMENRTLIIAMVNKAYVEGDEDDHEKKTMLDLFLQSFWLGGENTRSLLDHLLLVTVDQTAYDRCIFLRLHCYRLVTEGVDFGGEKLYMSNEFIKMMWRRTLFLTDVLKRGYNFIFTDTDVMWLNNPFRRLSLDVTEDIQISCDKFNGNPWSENNPVNTGFYFIRSNNRTISLFNTWYEMKDNPEYKTLKEQDVLVQLMRKKGVFRELGLKVRFLDTLYFSGFCADSKDFKVVATVHANCCRRISAKITDLTAVLGDWKRFKAAATNETLSTIRWSRHLACGNSWRNITV